MSKVAAAGSVTISKNMDGKRLGLKKSGGQTVISGNIIVRQRGTKFYPGKNVMMGRAHTICAVTEVVVFFRRMTGSKRGKFYIDVVTDSSGATDE